MRSKLWLRLFIILLLVLFAGWVFLKNRMPGKSYNGDLPPLSGEESELARRLCDHVTHLAGTIGERHVYRYDRLTAAADYIEKELNRHGGKTERLAFETEGRQVANLELILPGATKEIVVVGAHYDTGDGSPGANDNGSGVAALIELASLLQGEHFRREVRLVAFTNEEPPFYYTPQMGSLVYANSLKAAGRDVRAMLSLETIGFYSDVPGSQEYPFPLGYFYPNTANFIAFVGNLASGALVREAVGAFRRTTRFPSEGTVAPGWLTGIGWSDHWSFWENGYPAIMVTDTAFCRYMPYHTALDTPQQLNYDRMARVVKGLAQVVTDIAGKE